MEPQINNKKSNTKWDQLQVQLRQQIIQSLKKSKFNDPVPVQAAAIPLMLKNYDLAVQAQTGSGKTLAFIIPLLQRYLALSLPLPKPTIKYLIISPTRQLCQQTYSVLKKLLQNLPDPQRSKQYLEFVKCVNGGNQIKYDVEATANRTIVLIGTVGRVRELAGQNEQGWLRKVDYLYIDEADRVLKEKGINQLIRMVQKIRRTAMFSATLQGLQKKDYQFYGMRNLAKISLKSIQNSSNKNQLKPKSVEINNDDIKAAYTIPGSLSNTCMIMENRMQKIIFLILFLQAHLKTSKCIIFFNTCASVQFYTKLLNQLLVNQDQQNRNLIYGIHGKLKNNRRAKIIKSFTQNKNGCLLSTDVISRGIDFDRIHYIIQIDPPEDPDNYIHRIGRTARINRPGVAILLIQPHEQAFINYLGNKSVGVKLIESPQHFIKKYKSKHKHYLQGINQKIAQIMLSDRDYVQKSKKAFVSFIRSYTQHDLKYIFQFKNLSIGFTAQSFFLFRIPRVKQILGKKIQDFTQSQINPEEIPWKNRNQQMQYQKKKQKLIQMRQMRQRQKIALQQKMDIKNKKSRRKKMKQKRQKIESKSLRKQYSQFKRQKRGKNNNQHDGSMSQDQNFQSQNTEQIENRLGINQK